MNNIINQIINECKLRGISQRELSKRCGITEVSVGRYFNGTRTPSIEIAEKMANALGLELALIKKGVRQWMIQKSK